MPKLGVPKICIKCGQKYVGGGRTQEWKHTKQCPAMVNVPRRPGRKKIWDSDKERWDHHNALRRAPRPHRPKKIVVRPPMKDAQTQTEGPLWNPRDPKVDAAKCDGIAFENTRHPIYRDMKKRFSTPTVLETWLRRKAWVASPEYKKGRPNIIQKRRYKR